MRRRILPPVGRPSSSSEFPALVVLGPFSPFVALFLVRDGGYSNEW